MTVVARQQMQGRPTFIQTHDEGAKLFHRQDFHQLGLGGVVPPGRYVTSVVVHYFPPAPKYEAGPVPGALF